MGKNYRGVLYRLYSGRCFWCGVELKMENSTKDHVVPKSKRDGAYYPKGRDVFGKRKHTVMCVLSCKPCNMDRGNAPFHEYARSVGKILPNFDKDLADVHEAGENS